MKLDPDDVEAVARRVVELLGSPQHAPQRYVDGAMLARTLGIERDWVYAHAAELGAIRLGGPQGRLRFDLEHIRRALAGGNAAGRRARPQTGRGDVDRRARSS